MAYDERFVLVSPLRECADCCGVCLWIAHAMRYRLIECLKEYAPEFHVGQGQACESDETYFIESFKGYHSKGSFTLPKKARHCGEQFHKRGLSREQICAIMCIGDANATFFDVSGRSVVSRNRAEEALRGRIGVGAVGATVKATACIDLQHDLNVALHKSYDSTDRSEGTISRINTLHSLLDSYTARFKGEFTKHIGACLDWFRWRHTFMAIDFRTAEYTVARQLVNGTRATRIRDMFNVLPPYMDYWVLWTA